MIVVGVVDDVAEHRVGCGNPRAFPQNQANVGCRDVLQGTGGAKEIDVRAVQSCVSSVSGRKIAYAIFSIEIGPILDFRPLAGHPPPQLPNGVIDLRRTAQSLDVIYQNLGRARVGEQQRAQKMSPAAEFKRSPRMNALILGDMKLMAAQIGIGDVKKVVARRIFLGNTI